MSKKYFLVFPEYEDEVHTTKDPGIIAELLSQKYDTAIVCMKPSVKKHLCLTYEEIKNGEWLPDCNGVLVAYHQRGHYKPLFQKAKSKNYKIIMKTDTDGNELNQIFNPFNPAIYTQFRTERISLYKYIKHFRKFINLESWAKRRRYDMVDYIILETGDGYRRFIKMLSVFKDKFVFIPNGAFFKNDDYIKEKEKQIIAIGRWEDVAKYPEMLIAVLKEVLPKSGYKALIIGSYDEKLLNKYNELPDYVKDKISLLGKVPYEQVQQYLAESEIFLSTSRWESSGLASIEALSRGCSIACTNTGVATQTMDGLTGTVSRNLTTKDVVEALDNEINLWNSCVRSPEKIIAAARPVYDWNGIIKKIEELV